MLHRTLFLIVLLALATPALQGADDPQKGYSTPEAAAADPDFALQGEYVGPEVGVQVVALGQGKFQVVTYRGGLPGAGWNGALKQSSEEDREELKKTIADLQLKKTERKSPTLGAKPPEGAVVLFDGTPESLKKHWRDGARLSADKLLEQGVTSLDTFQDFSIHIEFRTPYMPLARGQGRGNSGLYYQGRYETQMLDSFGLEGKDNECGGIYSIKDPDVNMCLPPLVWQTYDAIFTAARFDKEGKKIANARVTVRHNGVLIHEDVELPRITTAAPNQESAEAGPIYLQDHGNPVRYRNIWVLPRDAQKEARRPVVPTFERFHAAAQGENVAGGRLLLTELNCTACHAAPEALANSLIRRPGPVLDQIGERTRPEWMQAYLADPHGVKPGTAMPDLLRGLPEAERAPAAKALTHLLASTGTLAEKSSDPQAIGRGKTLFHQIGCVACHAPREGASVPTQSSIPLGDLTAKYSISSLATFLENPHVARPSGRMPRLVSNPQEALDLANYLVGPVEVKPRNPNWKFKVYHGSWDNVPDYDKLKPVKEGESAGFNLGVAGRGNNFGMRFEGYVKIDKGGEYTFHLGSDDGSKLFIGGKKVADSDGVHPHTVNSGKVKLEPGMHAVRVDYAQVGGEATLSLEMEGPGLARQDANGRTFLTEQGPRPASPEEEAKEFRVDAALVEQGKGLFVNLGCANCHSLTLDGKRLEPKLQAKPLANLAANRGCLAAAVAPAARPPVPAYDLNASQRAALATAVASGAAVADSRSQIERTMESFNCYTCHARGGVGGPDRPHNPLFLTTIPEMGDEGRVPPPLDGVGDKLRDEWLQHVLNDGAKDRPYMLTRMPKFGAPEVSQLAAAFVKADRAPASPEVPLPESEIRSKAQGRFLAGDKALGCIKCHTFGGHQTPGIRGLDLQTMTRRVREDWFHRYMVDPPRYRPGTRMPTAFPEGKATVRDVYEGDPSKQLAALWSWLKDADKAGIPEGLVGNVIELRPDARPVIYRNFIEGLSARGIAVGYPERANLAWDANKLSLTLAWHGRFLDAGKHWEGRGPGFQGPLGDHLIRLEDQVPLAVLENDQAPWPTKAPRELGWRFKGYDLDPAGRPRFRYVSNQLTVEDFPVPVPHKSDAWFRRTLTIKGTEAVPGLYFRGAVGKIEAQANGEYLVNGLFKIRLPGGSPVLREVNGQQELLLPVTFNQGQATVVQEIDW